MDTPSYRGSVKPLLSERPSASLSACAAREEERKAAMLWRGLTKDVAGFPVPILASLAPRTGWVSAAGAVKP